MVTSTTYEKYKEIFFSHYSSMNVIEFCHGLGALSALAFLSGNQEDYSNFLDTLINLEQQQKGYTHENFYN